MKYKIVERWDGRFEVLTKKFFFGSWENNFNSVDTLEQAKIYVNGSIEHHKKCKEEESGKKAKRVVEVIYSE